MAALVTKARPQSIQNPPAHLTRAIFRFADPTGLSPGQWRLIAREPVNRSAQRFIIRELSALSWAITSSRRNDSRIDDYTERWEEIWEDGDGFHTWISRMAEDVCSLPFGAASETGYRGEDLDWAVHVDGATLLPTYERALPYVQVNPDDWTQQVYFRRGQLRRMRVNPRPDIRFKEFQTSPTEDAFTEIEALSKIYLYYMQELTDTVPLGLLDVMDWDEGDAVAWARNFREMIEGTDHIKIPILYDHTGEAKFIPFGRSPQDLNVVEQFKRFAEVLLSKYGLSIGDLRLFEHDSTKAGERVSQLVTERSGVGFWAALFAGYVTRLLPDGLTFEFKQPRPEREKVVADRKAVQLAMLQTAVGGKALISVKDAVEEALALELFTTEVKALEEQEPPPVPDGFSLGQPPQLGEEETEEELDTDDDKDLSKAVLTMTPGDFAVMMRSYVSRVGPMVEKALGPGWQHPEPPASERLAQMLERAFEGLAQAVDAGQVEEITGMIREAEETLAAPEDTVPPDGREKPSDEVPGEQQVTVTGEVEKGGKGSGNWLHAGRPGERGGSAARRTQAGITSHKPGKDIEQVRREMRQFRAKLQAIPGARNASVEEGTGAWEGGSEPTWVTVYEGDGQAIKLLAETGKRFDQDAVLVMQFVGQSHPSAQPVDFVDFGRALDDRSMRAVENLLIDQGFKGWTWSQGREGQRVLQVACIPQWGGEAQMHTQAISNVTAQLSEAGITARRNRAYTNPIVMDKSNYDDFIGR